MSDPEPRSALHAARAWLGTAWCLVLGALPFAMPHPAVLAAVLVAVLLAARAARVPAPVGRALRWSVPFALLWALINCLLDRNGATVLVRGVDAPVLGALDVTLEGAVAGAMLGLQVLAVVGVAALMAATVDADALLRSLRRRSLRTGLTAALAARLMPVLARDARRLADAQRCLPGAPPARVAVLRAVTTGALDRATDVAATLEVRGFGLPGVGAPRAREPWSRHDLAFAASALVLAALAAAVAVTGVLPFSAYPRLDLGLPPAAGAVVVLVLAAALVPFADRRGLAR